VLAQSACVAMRRGGDGALGGWRSVEKAKGLDTLAHCVMRRGDG